MFCTKCGEEIPEGEKKVCDKCEMNVEGDVIKEKESSWKLVIQKIKKIFIKKSIRNAILSLVVAAIIIVVINNIDNIKIFGNKKAGNTIGNIRNYGYAVESDDWIYYLSPNEDSTEIGIFKVKNNGKNKQQLYI